MTSIGTSSGVIYVHSAPAALCPHVEWAVSGEVTSRLSFIWTPQNQAPGSYRAEVPWTGPAGTAARIASAMRRWTLLRFEVTEDASADGEGARFACTPTLGLFTAAVNSAGDVVVSENRLRSALESMRAGGVSLESQLDALLGTAWDEELEVFRQAAEALPVRRLYRVS